jgi:hypothetical protein
MKKEYLVFAAILAVIFSIWIFGSKFILGAAKKQLRPLSRVMRSGSTRPR